MRKLHGPGVLIALLLVACGGDDGATPVDASAPDAGTVDAAPLDPGCAVLFLNFEPTDLVAGVADNPAQNVSTLLPESVTSPGFRTGDPSRDDEITAVVAQVRGVLEPLGVTVVTERPADPPFTMAVIGGASTDLGFPAGVSGATGFLSCGSPFDYRVTFAFEEGLTAIGVGNVTLRGYLIGLGVPQSSDPGSCLCWSGVACDFAAACTLAADTPRLAGQDASCAGAATFDAAAEVRAMLAACE
jgi:hypothetical protein